MKIETKSKILLSIACIACILLILIVLSSCSSTKNKPVMQEHELEQRDKDFEEFYNEHH